MNAEKQTCMCNSCNQMRDPIPSSKAMLDPLSLSWLPGTESLPPSSSEGR